MTTTVNPVLVIPPPSTDGAVEPSMSQRAYAAIRDRLVMLDIRPGDPINEQALAAELDLGRTPVREALKRLETERLVVSYARRGTFATEVQMTDLAHVSEVRVLLEPAAAAAAAERARPSERAVLASLAEGLGHLGEADVADHELMRADLRIHRAVYAATHNPHLEDTLVRYDNLATRIWCLLLDEIPQVTAHVEEHRPLLQAIVDGDAERAAGMARAHVEGFEAQVRALL